ncbi:MAG: DinB family protein [Thermoanaerobaculia bacterium]
MSLRAEALQQIQATRQFFDRTTRCLTESDSGFRATAETMTVAQQVAHAAQTIDWFREGALEDNWDMDFEKGMAATQIVTSLTAARRSLVEAWERLEARTKAATDEELESPMADNPILGSRRRYHLYEGIVDHCAHHRGALAVYARLAGKVPEMPYGD